MIMDWLILFIASCCEVTMTFCLGKTKAAEGLELGLWIAGFLIAAAASMGLLAKAAQTIPLGTAYAIWTGIGALGTVLIGIFVFHEPVSFLRIFFIFTLFASIVGLKLVS